MDDGAPTERRRLLRRVHARLHAHPVTGLVTKIVVSLIGLAVIVAGLVMLVAPGPGIVAIILGLAILATEWAWAERWMVTMKERAQSAAESARALDPAVRRRRIGWTVLAVLLVGAALASYVLVFDWPEFLVTGWERLRSRIELVPQLPGM